MKDTIHHKMAEILHDKDESHALRNHIQQHSLSTCPNNQEPLGHFESKPKLKRYFQELWSIVDKLTSGKWLVTM